MGTALQLNLSQTEAERDSKVDLVPAGDYQIQIIEVEAKQTKNQQGHYLAVYLRIAAGEHAGKVICDNLNIVHSNPDTQRISLSRLKRILEKGGHANPAFLADSDELVGLNLLVTVVESTYGDNNDKKSNNVRRYESVGTVAAGGTAVAANVVAAPPVAAPSIAQNVAVAPPVAAPPVAAPAPAIAAPAPAIQQPAANAPAAGGFPWGNPQ